MAGEQPELSWARDVIAVYEGLGKALPDDAPQSRKSLHAWVTEGDTDNRTQLFTKLVPTAIGIINKYDNSDREDEIVKAERRSIVDLRGLIEEAIREAKDARD